MSTRTIPVGYVRSAVLAARARGLDTTPVLSAAGISASLLDDPRARFTPEQVATLTRELWRHSDDELFGMGSAPVPLGSFRLICYALINSADLRIACARLVEFARVVRGGPTATLTEWDGTARIVFDLSNVHDHEHLVNDYLLVLVHRFCGWLIGRRIPLTVVEFPYPQPADVDEYDLIFGAPLQFDTDGAALEFDAALLALPIVRDEDDLERYLRHSPADVLTRRNYGTTLSDQVRRILERGLRGDWPDSDDVAARLSISTQHLRRLLRDADTSLGAIREEIMRDAAITGLARGESVARLSQRLGFSEASAFRRAFKRWTGATPAAYQTPRR